MWTHRIACTPLTLNLFMVFAGLYDGSSVAVKTVRGPNETTNWHPLNSNDVGLQTLFREAHVLRNAKHRCAKISQQQQR